eukprot:TRINITY_DN1571_c0_g1_i1.p1 TRINITY_DN1571_c0_g1~~TRINITY_DN1571_c0_g1_i1.p1  ORF type:complete len:312 (+),score=63.05 TRINITY_DN1571_c0_g1_i1:264-1199(+)
MVQLTEQMIMAKSRQDNIAYLKNLNMWGNDIDDVSVIASMKSVEVVSLSVNSISTLRYFGQCPNLTELYLRKNRIFDIREVTYLVDCKYLRVLWLSENPCAEVENYRDYVIRTLPQLVKLDNTDITSEERLRASRESFPVEEADAMKDFYNPPETVRRAPSTPQHVTRSPVQSAEGQRKSRVSSDPPRETRDARDARDARDVPRQRAPSANQNIIDRFGEDPEPESVAPRVIRMTKQPSRVHERPISTTPQLQQHQQHATPDRESIVVSPAPVPQNNILAAISCLLNELDVDAMKQLRAELDRRLTNRNLL